MGWLLTGIPALAVFFLVPTGSQLIKIVGPLLMILELGYIQKVADGAIKLKRAIGQFPMKERLKMAPLTGGLLIYALVFTGLLTGEAKVLMGCAAVALCSASKIWIARRPFWPAAGVRT